VVDTLTPSLADALTGGGDGLRALSDLVRTGSLVLPEPSPAGSVRYHPLLLSTLRARLAHDMPARTRTLHRRASAWYASQHLLSEAVVHAVRAGDWERAATAVVRDLAVGALVSSGADGARLARALDGLPATVSSPDVAVVSARAGGGVPRGRPQLDRRP
jgi:LuxR family maltose regulon positive regulatory protein